MADFSLSNTDISKKTISNNSNGYNEFIQGFYECFYRLCEKVGSSSSKISKISYSLLKEIDNVDDQVKARLTELANKLLEDDVSIRLADLLEENGYIAKHDVFNNGHVDLFVQSPDLKFKWLGEAKIYGGPKYLSTGFNQLNRRYSKGTVNECAGGILIYITDTSLTALDIINKWKTALTVKAIDDVAMKEFVCSSNIENPLILDSTHTHHLSGLPYSIKHICLDLRYFPDDDA